MDTQSNVVSIAAWSARRVPGGRARVALLSRDGGCQPRDRTVGAGRKAVSDKLESQGGRVVPLESAGTRTVPGDPAHPPTGPTVGTAA
jgi:hypothetical protein